MIDYQQLLNSYLEELNGAQLPEWLSIIKKAGQKDQVPIVDDSMGYFLRFLCSLNNPTRILEIGCGFTYSTHWMLLGAPHAHLIALDLNQERLHQSSNFLKLSGFIDQVELIQQSGLDFLAKNEQLFDLIFIDSMKRGYVDLLEPCYQALKINGLLVADNILFQNKVLHLLPEQLKKYSTGVAALKKFNQKASQHPGLNSYFLPISDGVLIAKKIK